MSPIENEQTFNGFEAPGTTPVPDYVFDFLMKDLTGNELKVLLYIIRRTFGFGKSADAISLSQFRDGMTTKEGKVLNVGCGVGHNRLLLIALNGLEKRGCIVSQKREGTDGSKETTIYKLRFKKTEQVVTPSNEVVTSGNQGGSYFTPQGVVTSGNQQETHVEQETENECVVSPTLPQPEITPTLPAVAPDYTTSATIDTDGQPSMQLSTQQASTVDNSQQSYSHKPATSTPTHVGKMPVLSVPMPPPIEGVKMPDAPIIQVKPQTFPKPATPPSDTLDEKKRLGLIAESIREKAPDIKGVTIAVLTFIDAWDQGKYGPCSLSRWEISNAKDIVLRMKGTIEEALLVADELKRQQKTVKIETVCNSWYLLETLRKPKAVSSHPNLYNEDNFAKDVWA